MTTDPNTTKAGESRERAGQSTSPSCARRPICRGLVLTVCLLACIMPVPGCAGGNAATASKGLYLVVTREIFAEAAQPLIEKRRDEGFEVVVSFQSPDEAIRALSPRRPGLLLLVGDEQFLVKGRVVELGNGSFGVITGDRYDFMDSDWRVPCKWEKRYRWREKHRRDFASDAAWGDLDGDRLPDIPVGRLPVRTPDELSRIVNKTLEYERQPPSLDDLRLPVFAGDPMNDLERDGIAWTLLGTMATQFLVSGVKADGPPWADVWLLSASPGQPFRGWPGDYPDLLSERLRRGGFLAILIGHGSQDSFSFARHQGEYVRYTAQDASRRLAQGRPGPPLAIFACNCGDFTFVEDCLAESLLRMPAGPVAVMAATAVSDSLPDYLVAKAMLQVARREGVERLGEFWLQSQRTMPVNRNPTLEGILLNSGTGYAGEEPDLDKLRRDSQLWSALLGDPATRLRLPRHLNAQVTHDGERWQWRVQKPRGAVRLHVAVRPRNTQTLGTAAATNKQELRDLLRSANEGFAFQELPAPPPDGPWEGTIDQQGTLRLVAFTPDSLYVAVLELEDND